MSEAVFGPPRFVFVGRRAGTTAPKHAHRTGAEAPARPRAQGHYPSPPFTNATPPDTAAAALPGHSEARVREPAGGQTDTSTTQGSFSLATDIGIKELLEAGVHFGHQTRRWNPKMRRFIFGERDGIHIIDLQKTERLLHNAQEFAGELAGRGGTVLFVGTKKQARDTIKEAADSCGMPYVDQRWLGGLLTNFQTINKRHPAPARAA